MRQEQQQQKKAEVVIADPNSLGGQMNSLAKDIQSTIKSKSQSKNFDNEPAVKRTLAIADDLAILAKAAESQDQQGVINAGRSVAANIAELVKDLTALAEQCPDRLLKEQMLRDAQGLKNYAVQLKIVASVSAANLGHKGGHERLVTMATSMTKSIKGCIDQVATATIKIGQKKK